MPLTATPHPDQPCPTCGQPTQPVEVDQPPVETTWDDFAALPRWRTFKPAPAATVTLACGHVVDGAAGLAWIDAWTAGKATGGIIIGPGGYLAGEDGGPAPFVAPADLKAYYERVVASLGLDRVSGLEDVSFVLDTRSLFDADLTTRFAQETYKPRTVEVTYERPDGRWQAAKARLRRRWPFRWLKVRTVPYTFPVSISDWPKGWQP